MPLRLKKIRQIIPPREGYEMLRMPKVEEYFMFNELGIDGKVWFIETPNHINSTRFWFILSLWFIE